MHSSHWSNRLPHIVPIWHEMSLKNISKVRLIDPNLEIDFGGIGVFNNTVYKNVSPCPYQIDRPMLPYFVHPNRSLNQFTGNCLTYCREKKILFSSKLNRIYAHQLSSSPDESDSSHQFTGGQFANSPFHENITLTTKYNDGKIDSNKYFLELKVCEGEKDETELLVIGRESMKLLTYSPESEEKFTLDLEIGLGCDLFPTKKSHLNFVDRNETILEQYLVGFLRDSKSYRWDVESETLFTDLDLKLDFTNKLSKFIGLQWAINLNPFLYFYGTHSTIGMCDTRLDCTTNRKPPLLIAQYEQFTSFHGQEMFQAFTTCKLEPHQVITSSDFKINFLDIRYPNENIFQTKDNFVWNNTSKLCRNNFDGRKLFLLASNSKQCCLNSFEIGPELQPKQQHLPFHVNLPHDIDAVYPTFEYEDRYFFQGIELLAFPNSSFFSVALLLNSGDIFLQDFKVDQYRQTKDVSDSNHLADYKYENDTGRKVYINQDIDEITLSYLKAVKAYVDQNATNMKPLKYENKEFLECKKCKLDKNFKCKPKGVGFCLCLSSRLLNKERKLIENDSSEDEENRLRKYIPTKASQNVKLDFSDDELDLAIVKENWYHLNDFPEKDGVRSICGEHTAKLFDRWVGPSLVTPLTSTSSVPSEQPSTSSMSMDM